MARQGIQHANHDQDKEDKPQPFKQVEQGHEKLSQGSHQETLFGRSGRSKEKKTTVRSYVTTRRLRSLKREVMKIPQITV